MRRRNLHERRHNPGGRASAVAELQAYRHAPTKVMADAEAERFAEAVRWDWDFWARPDQKLPPGDWWSVWLLLAGRGFGKTRTGAETIRELVKQGVRYIGFVGRTPADVRDVMIEGESGILAISPPNERPIYEPSKLRLTWPNGATAWIRSAQNPSSLRGPQAQVIWADELASWPYLPEVWDNMQFSNRLGDRTRFIVTTTPRPRKRLREVLASNRTVVTSGSTYENAAFLAADFIERVRETYEGTSVGRQELYGELLEAAEGALWTPGLIEPFKVWPSQVRPELVTRTVVALDPADGSEEGDEQGLCVAMKTLAGHFYVVWSEGDRSKPLEWATRAVDLYHYYDADRLIYEANKGGVWVGEVLRQVDPRAAIHAVNASKGKRTRAEPIVGLYEQGRVHHFRYRGDNPLEELEDQMVNWVPGNDSPDRLDALVWALTELNDAGPPPSYSGEPSYRSEEQRALLGDWPVMADLERMEP